MYNEIVRDHFANPRNCGPLNGATHRGNGGTPGDGPYVVLWFKVVNGCVEQAAWNANGCPASMACASMAAELATGRTVEEVLQLHPDEIMRCLGGLPDGKEHAAWLAIDAIQDALYTPIGP